MPCDIPEPYRQSICTAIARTDGTQHIVLTPNLAARCGYSMESDPWGNTRIYSSLLGCYIDNHDDQTFNVGLRLRLFGPSGSDLVTHDVMQTCSYTRWASREILCDRNYMEVSHHIATPEAQGQTQDVKESDIIPDVCLKNLFVVGLLINLHSLSPFIRGKY
ncbi:hypothetical protein EYF80_057131 [Liparis tanakae]|uniref:Uncharacterized protein n=1 Tax=Liparis tanakae TaxID=230148 RepID=A0A4Z2EV48_9TELE|nr:hypothetical protein EYF80_057131 [Liparis tanakae]